MEVEWKKIEKVSKDEKEGKQENKRQQKASSKKAA